MNLSKLKKLSGDASFRNFYRKKNSVFVYCKKEKKSNLLIYDAINKILNKNNIKAPKLISQNYKKNYIEIEDLGDLTVLNILNKKKKKISYYKKIIKMLCKIQKIKTKKIKTFLKNKYIIPNYSKRKLLSESNLFLEWYLPKFIKGNEKKKIKKKLYEIFNKLLNNLYYKKRIFVHRDFHVSNIMSTKNGLVLIDSQDAVFGHVAYDLASLIDDVRFKTSKKLKDEVFNEFLKINYSLDRPKFKNDFEILSVLRNLKIIGIFARLYERDKKKKYLKLIPHAWKLIENRIKENKQFIDLKKILENYFIKISTYEN